MYVRLVALQQFNLLFTFIKCACAKHWHSRIFAKKVLRMLNNFFNTEIVTKSRKFQLWEEKDLLIKGKCIAKL